MSLDGQHFTPLLQVDAVAVHGRLDTVPDLAVCDRDKQHVQAACPSSLCERGHLPHAHLAHL